MPEGRDTRARGGRRACDRRSRPCRRVAPRAARPRANL